MRRAPDVSSSIFKMRDAFWSILLTLLALLGLGAIVYFIMHFATEAVGLPAVYWMVPLFGASGGAVGGILRNENNLTLCRMEIPNKVTLGVIGDICVGLGGACAVVFLFGSTLRIDPKDALSSVLLISMSFLAGAFGKDIVTLAGERLLKRAREEARATAKEEAGVTAEEKVAHPAAVAYAYAATQMNNSRDNEQIPQALKMAELALKYDPKSIHAYVEKGRALKLLGDVKGALGAIEEALRIRPDDARLRYNRACYMSLLKMDTDVILAELKRACGEAPQLCELARRDADLNGLRDTPRFRELMLDTLEGALRNRTDAPDTPILRYTKACYMSLLKMGTDAILAELKEAFAVQPKLREKAVADADLETVRNLPEFKELLGIK